MGPFLKALEANSAPRPKPLPADTQMVCIELPGEMIRCNVHKTKLKIVVRKHREVIFDIALGDGGRYTVQAEHGRFFFPESNQLETTIDFIDGARTNLWVGREFKGGLILKNAGRLVGRYVPNELDTTPYGLEPTVKPEPLMIAMGKSKAVAHCTSEDIYGIAGNHEAQKALFERWLKEMPKYGSQFDYSAYAAPQEPQVQEYAVVTLAEAYEVLPHIREQLAEGGAVEDVPERVFSPPTAASALVVASEKFGETMADNAWKETVGYIQEHWKQFGKLGMKVYIEKAPLGKYRVVFRGRTLRRVAGKAATQAAGWALEKKIVKRPMGAPNSAWLDGGYGKTGKAGLGGAKRITLTVGNNFKSGMKIQLIGTVIDVYGDVSAVFGEDGSKDMSEFLGRAGVTFVKAGATAVLGSLMAAGFTALFATAAAPVFLVVVFVVAGYILAATMVDSADTTFQVKERAAAVAR